MSQSRNSYMEAELMAPPLDELGKVHEEEVDEDVEEEDEEGSYHAHLDQLVQNLLEEAKDKSKGWVARPTTDHTELAYKKVRTFRFWNITGFQEMRSVRKYYYPIYLVISKRVKVNIVMMCLYIRWGMVTL